MKFFFTWIIVLCRVVVGAFVFKVGFDFSRRSGAFAYHDYDDNFLGIFVMVVGIYFIFSSIFRGLFGYEPTDLL